MSEFGSPLNQNILLFNKDLNKTKLNCFLFYKTSFLLRWFVINCCFISNLSRAFYLDFIHNEVQIKELSVKCINLFLRS